jgi:hypothetical protein
MRREQVETPSGYRIKPLQGGDLRRLKKIIADNFGVIQTKLKAAERERMERQKEMGPGTVLPPDQGAGMAIMEVILDDAFDQAYGFLAHMAGMTVEAFDEEPLDAHLEVIETLVEEDDLPGFLGRYITLRRTFGSVLPTNASSDIPPPSTS